MRKFLYSVLAVSFLVTAGFDTPSFAAASSNWANAGDSEGRRADTRPS